MSEGGVTLFGGGITNWHPFPVVPTGMPVVPTGMLPVVPNGMLPGVPNGNIAPAAVVVRTSLELLDLLIGAASPLLPTPPPPPPPKPFWAAAAAAAWWARVAVMGSAERASGAGDEALVETAALWLDIALFVTLKRRDLQYCGADIQYKPGTNRL